MNIQTVLKTKDDNTIVRYFKDVVELSIFLDLCYRSIKNVKEIKIICLEPSYSAV